MLQKLRHHRKQPLVNRSCFGITHVFWHSHQLLYINAGLEGRGLAQHWHEVFKRFAAQRWPLEARQFVHGSVEAGPAVLRIAAVDLPSYCCEPTLEIDWLPFLKFLSCKIELLTQGE